MQVLAPARDSTTAADACARAMLDGMPPVMWFIRCHMRKHRTGGLSVPQFRALCLIDRYPTAGVSLVAEHLGCTQPSASRLVTGLVSRGLLSRRERPDDRRQVELALTTRGRSILAAARNATQQRLADEIAHLPPNQRQTVIAAMKILHDVFDCNPKP